MTAAQAEIDRTHGGLFGRSPLFLWCTVGFLFLLGLGVRLLDVDEPPLDFHPDRQLQSALIARGLYYRWLPQADPETRSQAETLGAIWVSSEPPIQEGLVAATYLIAGGELLWLARLWSILFWMIGGWILFRLAWRLANPDGAVIALAFYFIVPMGVYVSRSFQPDSMMVMLLVAAAAAAERWATERSWKWTLLAGLMAGLVVLSKGRPAPIVAGMLVGTVLAAAGLRRAVRDPQVWVLAAITVLLPAFYYVFPRLSSVTGYLTEYSGRVAGLLFQPSFYIRWALLLDDIVYLGLAALGLVGVAILAPRARGLLLGLWVGYLVYGLSLSYPIMTHNYYSAPLIPIVALSLAPIGKVVLGEVAGKGRVWAAYSLLILLGLIAYRSWLTRSVILSTDYRPEPYGWIAMGRALPGDGRIIGLTHDYGARVAYYGWKHVLAWPVEGDLKLFALQGRDDNLEARQVILEKTQNYRYFLVTLFGELEKQPALQQFLAELPVAVEGDGFILYDLEGLAG